jgi:hypothetical protein
MENVGIIVLPFGALTDIRYIIWPVGTGCRQLI